MIRFLLMTTMLTSSAAVAAEESGPDEVIITAPYSRNQQDILQSTSVVTAEKLARELRPTLGETLARQPGVSSTSFGPGASRPVLRGFQGERIRVLVDGIGSIDVSNTSPDHAVASEPLTATRIEILRGPATLLFGSSAIGGVVNQIDSRIADKPLGAEAKGRFVAGYGTAANDLSVAGTIDAQISPNLIVHADGSWRDTDDLRIAGFTRSRALRAATGGTTADDEALKGKLVNSFIRTKTAAAGVTGVSESSAFGGSISLYDSVYGIPDGAGDETGIRLDIKQIRADVKGHHDVEAGFLKTVKVRAGYADYRHFELEDTGYVGTRFDNEAWEGRLEFVQQARGGWQGAFGLQAFDRDFAVAGEEAFVAPNKTRQYGLFTLQEFDLGQIKLEGAARYERTRTKTDSLAVKRTFNAISLSGGGQYRFTDETRLGISLSRVERAPSAEELFSNGPHAATRAFEVGNPDFAKEKSWGVDVNFHADYSRGHIMIGAYYSRFDGYIYEQETGNIVDDLTEFQFLQADARYYGVEAEADLTLYEKDGQRIVADVVADLVRAKNLDTNIALPRIPAARVLLGLEGQTERVDLRGEIELVAKQNRVTTFELPSAGYKVVNLSANIRPFGRERNVSILVQANNLFDVDARRHASFLKDFAPLGGRDIRVSLRLGF
jgi:iron complex outermembrane recepter protein